MLDAVPSAEAQRIAARIEELGFPTLWIPETIGRDPFVTATLLLSATSKLNVATGIANIYARDALTMANTQRSLEEAFPGRFLLGLGVSHHHLVDRVRHHEYSKPYSRMVELPRRDGQRVVHGGRAERAARNRACRARAEDVEAVRRTRRRRASVFRARRAHGAGAGDRRTGRDPRARADGRPRDRPRPRASRSPARAWRCTSARRTT